MTRCFPNLSLVTVDCGWGIAEYVSGFCVVASDGKVWFRFDKLWLLCSVQSRRRGVQQGRLGEFVRGPPACDSRCEWMWTHTHTHTCWVQWWARRSCSGCDKLWREVLSESPAGRKSGHTRLVENYCSRFCVGDERGDGSERGVRSQSHGGL